MMKRIDDEKNLSTPAVVTASHDCNPYFVRRSKVFAKSDNSTVD